MFWGGWQTFAVTILPTFETRDWSIPLKLTQDMLKLTALEKSSTWRCLMLSWNIPSRNWFYAYCRWQPRNIYPKFSTCPGWFHGIIIDQAVVCWRVGWCVILHYLFQAPHSLTFPCGSMNGFPLYMPHLEWWYSTPSTGFIELVTVCFDLALCIIVLICTSTAGDLVLRQLGFFPFRQKQWPFQ